jgi:exonuclease SbcC
MKPEKLIIRNFGPFLGEEILDFSSLESIFLITGKTGAGKTSIFDAMCFALYGYTPRSGRNADFLTSDFNKNREESSVTFFFAVHDRHYKVYRTLFYTRKAKHGGKDIEEDMLTLEEVDEDGSLRVASEPNKTDTGRAIEQLIGLKADQFMKIVLLPQGEFAQFLKQSTNDRRALLGKLFPMEQAKKIMQRAGEKAKKAEAELAEVESRIAGLSRVYSAGERDTILREAQSDLEAVKQKAASLAKTERELLEARGTVEAAGEKKRLLRNAEEEAAFADKAFTDAEQNLAEAARGKQALPEFLHRQNALITRRAVIVELVKMEDSIPALENKRQGYLKRKTELESEAAALGERSQKTQAAVHSLEKKAGSLGILEEAFDKAKTRYENLAALQKTSDEKRKTEADEKGLQARILQLSGTIDELQVQIHEIESRITVLDGQIEAAKQNTAASGLAKSLVDGEPCPVCGSREHPSPARIVSTADDLARSMSALQKMAAEKKEQLAARNNEKIAAETKHSLIRARLEDLVAAEAEKTRRFRDSGDDIPAGDVNAALIASTEKVNQVQREKEDARRSLGQLHDGQKELRLLHEREAAISVECSRLEAEEKNIRKKIEEIEEKKEALLSTENAGAAIAAETAGAAPENNRASARDELSALDSRITNLERTINTIRESQENAGKDFAAASARRENARNNHEAARSAWENARAALDAIRDDRYKDSGVIGRALHEIAGEKETVEKDRDNAVARLTQITKDMEYLREAEEKRERLSGQYALLKALADDLNGSGKNHAKISFDTWLLARNMREIAAFASVRLNMMSEGRFHILLDEDGQKGGAGLKGLDLAVFDENTGTNRPCGTLSGGESFLASISLAMGLADSVQSRAGGIKLDAVFIDEGFGALDETALEKALGIFDEISANRMVALISHVEELRTRIPCHVEVIKTKGGSHIRRTAR